MKLILENWRAYVNEAIIDVVSEDLSDVFENGRLKDEVVQTIERAIAEIRQQFPDLEILDYYMVGAAVTYQYSPTSDIDTTLTTPQDMDPKQYKIVDKWIEKNIDPKYMFEQRPYQFKVSPKTRKELQAVDSAYDIRTQKWIKTPDKEKAKIQRAQYVTDPESYENRMYKAVERSVQPSMKRLYKALESEDVLSEGLSEPIQKLMTHIYNGRDGIYDKIKKFRGKAYSGQDARTKERISQNWGSGNIIYKFLDREGYNVIFDSIKKAVRSNFEIVDDKFIQDLKQKLSKVINDEIGFSI